MCKTQAPFLLVPAADGRKMSKRLKNYPDPSHILDTYGADALRLYMINSPIVRAEDLCFTEEGVVHSLRHLLIPWWNAYTFFVTYANVDNWTPSADPDSAPSSDNPLDRWIISATDRLAGDVVTAMDAYDLQRAVRPLVQFLDDLTNWYIRRSRRRFWKSGDDADKASAYNTLHSVLLRLCRIAAPFVPFISEEIYRNLRTPSMPESVHLCDYPLPNQWPRVVALDTNLTPTLISEGLARELVNRIQNLRKDTGLEVSDRITLTLQSDAPLLAAADLHRDFIQSETLSVSLTLQPLPSNPPPPSTSTAIPPSSPSKKPNCRTAGGPPASPKITPPHSPPLGGAAFQPRPLKDSFSPARSPPPPSYLLPGV